MAKPKTTSMSIVADAIHEHSDQYESFLQSLEENYNRSAAFPVFTTVAENINLYDGIFLAGIPEEVRQTYNCNACREFVNKYGGLVTIDSNGNQYPLLWNEATAPTVFAPMVAEMQRIVKSAAVNGVFLSSEKTWGKPVTGEWHHMAIRLPQRYNSLVLNASQRMAELKADYQILCASMADFKKETVAQALSLLRTEQLYRSEKVLGVAEWLYNLHEANSKTKSLKTKNNLRWLAVATAPAGFCHIRASMIGTLLEDLKAGMQPALVQRRFAEKMNPLQYQRPQAAPTVGNIESAEKLVAKLGIERSLLRRYARIDELELLWSPRKEQSQKSGGVFGHLTAKNQSRPSEMSVSNPLNPQPITWAKFSRTVLPDAIGIKFYVRHTLANYCAIVTAVDLDAPPILQWDKAEKRNPFSNYVYHNGSMPAQWNLATGWVDVTGITYTPAYWHGNTPANQRNVTILVLDGAKDLRYKTAGLAIFPETLKSELHGIRSTIEAYSNKGTLEGYEEASACGVGIAYDAWKATVRVQTKIGITDYNIDRWE